MIVPVNPLSSDWTAHCLEPTNTVGLCEGPEVRRAADRINSALAGKLLQEVDCTVAAVAPLAASMVGKRFEQVETRGKAFLLYVEDHDPIYVHLQLYGRWVISRASTAQRSNRTLRLRFSSGTKQALLYSATDVGVLKGATEPTPILLV